MKMKPEMSLLRNLSIIKNRKVVSFNKIDNLKDRGFFFEEYMPIFKRVKKYIVWQIENGEWPQGACIPSENAIVEEMGVSRSTVSKALRELMLEGILTRIQGVGTFVAAKKPPIGLIEIKPIAEEISARGGVHSSRVLLLKKELLNKTMANDFDMQPGYPIYHSILIHFDSGKPVQLSDRYVNPLFAPDYLEQDFTKLTPSAYLFGLGQLGEAEHIVEAAIPDKSTQRFLEIDTNEPCLILHRRTWTNNIVVTSARFTYPGSRIKLGSRFRPNTLK